MKDHILLILQLGKHRSKRVIGLGTYKRIQTLKSIISGTLLIEFGLEETFFLDCQETRVFS